ncbi:MAG: YjbF family lipoprotein [Gammaproteobacteria bacterium]
MNFLIKIVVCALLFSCSSLPNEAYEEIYAETKNILKNISFSGSSREEYSVYKSSYVKVKLGSRVATLILKESSDNNHLEWLGNDNVKIVTSKNGAILQTIGLDHNISITPGNIDEKGNLSIMYCDFYDPNFFHVQGILKKSSNSKDKITYLEEQLDTDKIENTFFYREINWTASNVTHFFNKKPIYTEQKIHPNLSKIEMYFYFN